MAFKFGSLDSLQIELKRWHYYFLALVVKLIVAAIFIDRLDGQVFTATAYDLLVDHKNIYYEGSAQSRFNYFPLAFLTILPGMAIYYFLIPFTSPVLERVFLKLPIIFAELWLAYLFRVANNSTRAKPSSGFSLQITYVELFLLFNPIILYAGSYKGQFDVFPAIAIIYAWRYFEQNQDFKAGIATSIAVLIKQHGAILIFLLFIALIKKNQKRAAQFVIGNLVVAIPVLTVGALLNFQGMVNHAILFHLGRLPNGYSITSVLFYFFLFGGKAIGLEQLGKLIAYGLLNVLALVLVLAELYLGYLLIKKPRTKEEIMRYILYGYGVFFLLNKGFLIHYLVVFVVLWVEYRRIEEKPITSYHVAWAVVAIPLLFAFKVALMTPADIRTFLGPYWAGILWFLLIFIHFILVKVISDVLPLLEQPRTRRIYYVIVALLPLHLAITLYIASLEQCLEGPCL